MNAITEDFLNRHWKKSNHKPVWSDEWIFDGKLPNHDKQGCYALFSKGEVVYIGIGIGRGTESYENNGIGYRTKRYWQLNKENSVSRRYSPRAEWSNVDSIRTIGFEPQDAYLAAALEIFLIQRLNPLRNSQHRRI